MEIYQTIKITLSKEKIYDILKMLSREEKVVGIRFNLCKCWKKIDFLLPDIIDIVCKFSSRFTFLFDLPYPRDKSRILRISWNDQIVHDEESILFTNNPKEFLIQKELQRKVVLVDGCFLSNLYKNKTVYYADGETAFLCTEKKVNYIKCICLNTYKIDVGKGITAGIKKYPISEIYKITDFIAIIKEKCKSIFAFSFIDSYHELSEIIQVLDKVEVMAKIETAEAIENIDEFAEYQCCIMIARGDLAFSVKKENFLSSIEHVVAKTKNRCKVFFATDILLSTEFRFFPSRADLMDLLQIKSYRASGLILPYRNEDIIRHNIRFLDYLL